MTILKGHATLRQRRINVDAISWRCIDVDATLYKRHLPARLSIKILQHKKCLYTSFRFYDHFHHWVIAGSKIGDFSLSWLSDGRASAKEDRIQKLCVPTIWIGTLYICFSAHRCPTGGFLLLQNFSVVVWSTLFSIRFFFVFFFLLSPHLCFIIGCDPEWSWLTVKVL